MSSHDSSISSNSPKESNLVYRKSGYILLRSDFFGSWKKRWFVLVGNTLYCYRNSINQIPKWTLQIDKSVIVQSAIQFTNKKNSFCLLRDGQKPYILWCETQVEMVEWIKLFNAQYVENVDTKTIEAIIDCIIISDIYGTIIGWNPAAEKLFGWTKEEALNENVKIITPSPYKERHDGFLLAYRHTGERKLIGITRKFPAITKNGTIIKVELSLGEYIDPKNSLNNRYIASFREVLPTNLAASESFYSDDSHSPTTLENTKHNVGQSVSTNSPVSGAHHLSYYSFDDIINGAKVNIENSIGGLLKSTEQELRLTVDETITTLGNKYTSLEEELKKVKLENEKLKEEIEITKKVKEFAVNLVPEDKRIGIEIFLKGESSKQNYRTFLRILKNPDAFEQFLGFLSIDKTSENGLFWKDVNNYKQTYPTDATNIAHHIFSQYIDAGSTNEINISDSMRVNIKEHMDNPTKTLFDGAIGHVLETLYNNSFKRFLSSKEGMQFRLVYSQSYYL